MNISSSLLSVTMDKKEANNKKKPRTFSKQRPRGAKGGWAHTQGERESLFFTEERERARPPWRGRRRKAIVFQFCGRES
jgi:hypothetical protein